MKFSFLCFEVLGLLLEIDYLVDGVVVLYFIILEDGLICEKQIVLKVLGEMKVLVVNMVLGIKLEVYKVGSFDFDLELELVEVLEESEFVELMVNLNVYWDVKSQEDFLVLYCMVL